MGVGACGCAYVCMWDGGSTIPHNNIHNHTAPYRNELPCRFNSIRLLPAAIAQRRQPRLLRRRLHQRRGAARLVVHHPGQAGRSTQVGTRRAARAEQSSTCRAVRVEQSSTCSAEQSSAACAEQSSTCSAERYVQSRAVRSQHKKLAEVAELQRRAPQRHPPSTIPPPSLA